MKKHLLPSATFIVTLTFLACGDESSTNSYEVSSQNDEIITIDDLPKCTSKKEGNTLYVSKEEANYICKSGNWVLKESNNDSTQNSSDSNEGASNSKKIKSSSSVKVSSSSKIKSSSSKKNSSSSVVSSSSSKINSSSSIISSSSSKINSSSSIISSSSSKINSSSSIISSSSSSRNQSLNEELGTCNKDNANNIIKASDGNTYQCRRRGSNATSPYKWFLLSDNEILELEIGVCKQDNIGSTVQAKNGDWYRCKVDLRKNVFGWEKTTEINSSSSIISSSSSSRNQSLNEELGTCNKDNANNIIKASDGNTYQCRRRGSNATSPYKWVLLSDNEILELEIGVCKQDNIGSTVQAKNGDWYRCKVDLHNNGFWWEKTTEEEIEFGGLNCTNETSGHEFIGNSGTKYICNNNHSGEKFMTLDALKKYVFESSCKSGETLRYRYKNFANKEFYEKGRLFYGEWNCEPSTKKWKFANQSWNPLNAERIGFQVWNYNNMFSLDNRGIEYKIDDEFFHYYKRTQAPCESPFHLPNNDEWKELISFIVHDNNLSDNTDVGLYLKFPDKWISSSTIKHFTMDEYANLPYKFNAKPSGYIDAEGHAQDPLKAYYLSATPNSAVSLSHFDNKLDIVTNVDNNSSYLVRCVGN